MKIDDHDITEELRKIRKTVGGRKIKFIPHPYPENVDRDLTEAKEVRKLFHASGLLIDQNGPVFIYIRDHTDIRPFTKDPYDCKKVHFTVCTKLNDMQRRGLLRSRYRMTWQSNDKYLIDIYRRNRDREIEQTLYPCQYCLGVIGYKCFDRDTMTQEQRYDIVESFTAKDALNLLRQRFDIFQEFQRNTQHVRPANTPTGYAANQKAISLEYRTQKGFVCEKCGRNFSARQDQRLTDTHHIDRDKSNNHYDNLACLCKACHAEEHPHYQVKQEYKEKIKRIRKRKN